MKKSVLILTVLLSIHLVYSQNRTNDSLEKLLATSTGDSARISALGNLAWNITWSNPEHALELARHLLLLARNMELQEHGKYKLVSALERKQPAHGWKLE